MKEKPNIFSYDDFRLYLQDWFLYKKDSTKGFSYRAFSELAGYKSPNQLLLIIQGKRGLPISKIDIFAKIIDFKPKEKEYFEILLKFNQENNLTQKKKFFNELSAFRKKRGHQLESKEYRYLTNWYYAAIREMVTLKDFNEDPKWIAKKLHGLITPAQAKRALKTLLDLKLLTRNNENKLCHGTHYVTTGNETQELTAFMYHEQMSQITLEALKSKDTSHRNITALTFSIRQQDYDSIVEELNKFRKRIVNYVEHRLVQDEDDRLYQMNLQFVPLSLP